jgi:plastocyanin
VAFSFAPLSAAPKMESGGKGRTVTVAVSPGGKIRPVPGGLAATGEYSYVPATVTVRPGDTVVWENKGAIPEPHTVTFLRPNPKSGELIGGGPLMMPRPKAGKEGSKDPKDLEFILNAEYLLPSELTGAKFANSGFLWAAGMGPQGAQARWSRTFSADDAGKTLVYTCALHPWMTGEVRVAK